MSSTKQTLDKTSQYITESGIHESDIHMAYEVMTIGFVVLLIYLFSYFWEWVSVRLDCCHECNPTDSPTNHSMNVDINV